MIQGLHKGMTMSSLHENRGISFINCHIPLKLEMPDVGHRFKP